MKLKSLENSLFILIIPLLLTLIGLLNLYSVTFRDPYGGERFFHMQMVWAGIGVVVMFVVAFLSIRVLHRLSLLFYVTVLLLLAAVFVFGVTSWGARRWLDLGFFTLQPSELAKLAMIFMLARYFGDRGVKDTYHLRELIPPVVLVAIPAVMIILQPDLGTALIAILTGLSICAVVRVDRQLMYSLIGLLTVLFPVAWFFLLRDYQKGRILSFLNPADDPMGTGYHAIQSAIAIGSGRWFGKGFLQGTQAHLNFLPADHTDFVFSVFAEEWGFFASIFIILLYFALFMNGLAVAREASNRFAMFLALGATAVLFWHTVTNIGMVTGLLPVVGVPLPFFSYGGTAMISSWFCVGLLMNVRLQRFGHSV